MCYFGVSTQPKAIHRVDRENALTAFKYMEVAFDPPRIFSPQRYLQWKNYRMNAARVPDRGQQGIYCFAKQRAAQVEGWSSCVAEIAVWGKVVEYHAQKMSYGPVRMSYGSRFIERHAGYRAQHAEIVRLIVHGGYGGWAQKIANAFPDLEVLLGYEKRIRIFPKAVAE